MIKVVTAARFMGLGDSPRFHVTIASQGMFNGHFEYLGTSITPGTSNNAARNLIDLFPDLSGPAGIAGLGSYGKTTANTGSPAFDVLGEPTSAVLRTRCRDVSVRCALLIAS